MPASGLGEVLATRGGLWLGEGRQRACFPSCGQLGGHTHTHTHTRTHSLALSTWVVPASSWALWACLPEGTAGPRASRKWGEGPASRGRGPSEVSGSRRAWPGSCGPWGSQSSHLGSGVCGHSWVRLPSSLLVLTCGVSAGGVFLAPINAWARAPPPPNPQAGYDKGQWGHLE